MGIHDRDYMRRDPGKGGKIPEYQPDYGDSSLTIWQKFRFAIWRLLHRR